jgi:excisionase family DNA binding protein
VIDERMYLATDAAARYLGLSERTLKRYRAAGGGPAFHRFGARVRYRREDLDVWAAARRRVSTVDDGTGAGAVRALVGAAALAAAVLLAGPDAALATSDTTFGGPLGTVKDIVSGTGGQLAAALAVGAALVGSVLRFNAMQLMGAVGVGVAAGAGTGIVTGLVGSAIV